MFCYFCPLGNNADGEVSIGFCLNNNESKILEVEPGDKFIHLPDSMKHAAKVGIISSIPPMFILWPWESF